MASPLARLARRVEDDPAFLASALKQYALSEGLDGRGLAAALACPVESLARLALCRRPRPNPPWFRQDVDRIARRFGANADALATVVRRADALARLRGIDADAPGLLMAARDQSEAPPTDEATDDRGRR
ncbi:MAG: hypothetical protein ACRDIY_12900 [Chloroflexota bacterium]